MRKYTGGSAPDAFQGFILLPPVHLSGPCTDQLSLESMLTMCSERRPGSGVRPQALLSSAEPLCPGWSTLTSHPSERLPLFPP